MKTYTDKITGFPDGMTIDEEDNLYIALYGGGSVIKVNPRTAELVKVTYKTWIQLLFHLKITYNLMYSR